MLTYDEIFSYRALLQICRKCNSLKIVKFRPTVDGLEILK